MKPEDVINAVGGRKNMLGYIFIVCVTFLVWQMMKSTHTPDYVGMTTVIAAIAAGLASIIWGNVKEHQAKNQPKEEVKQ